MRTVPLELIADRDHYEQVIQAVLGATNSVWIATANLTERAEMLGRLREAAVEDLTAKLQKMSIKIKNKEEMANVASIASNNDREIGELLNLSWERVRKLETQALGFLRVVHGAELAPLLFHSSYTHEDLAEELRSPELIAMQERLQDLILGVG